MWGIGVFISLSVLNVICQEDSLRSALNAIDRRQEEYPRYEDGEYGYPMERPDDLSFIKAASDYNSGREFHLYFNFLIDLYDANTIFFVAKMGFNEIMILWLHLYES